MKHDLYRLTKGEVELAAEGPHGERLLNLALHHCSPGAQQLRRI